MDNGFNISGECRTYSDVAFTHCHTFAQLILPLQGTMSIKTAGPPLEVDEARLFFLPPGCPHTFLARSRNRFLVLDIGPQLLPGPYPSPAEQGQAGFLDERWQALRFLMLAEIERPGGDRQGLLDLFRYAYDRLLPPARPRSLEYLQHHYDQPLDLGWLAGLEGYSPAYYSEWFKQVTGQTATAYLHQLRLDQARRLLRETDLPILHIAQQVGYEHHASLTRLFQQQYRLTPSAYRRLNQKPVKK
jgi:AraC-like DNA-binding protein